MRKNQSLAEVQSRILTALDRVYDEHNISATIVQGDTMTVLCGTLCSFYKKVPVSIVSVSPDREQTIIR